MRSPCYLCVFVCPSFPFLNKFNFNFIIQILSSKTRKIRCKKSEMNKRFS
jgi:hypothetical protein